jgi:hypothetical protein
MSPPTAFLPRLSASNFTEAIPEEQLVLCGASDCLMATAATNSTQRPSQELIYMLLGIYTGTCPRLGRVLTQGLSPQPRRTPSSSQDPTTRGN